MIQSKKELKFYIMADMMMNRGKYKWNLKDRLYHILFPDNIMQYLRSLRYCNYYIDNHVITPPLHYNGCNIHGQRYMQVLKLYRLPKFLYHMHRYRRLGLKLGFSIGCRTELGYGVVIPHYGTIVVGGSNKIGNFAVLHTSTCISDNGKTIGDGLYLATGAKMTSSITLGDNVSVGANSVVNKSFQSNCMIAGTPAKVVKEAVAWYERDGESYANKVKYVEDIKKKMGL